MNNRGDVKLTKVENVPIWARIIRTAQLVDNRIDAALGAVDLTRAKLAVLHNIVEAGEPISLTKLAGLQSCVKSNMTNLIDRMESDGLVERINDDQDRRTIHVRVTPGGKRLYKDGMTIVAKEEERLLLNLGGGEREQLSQLLSRLDDSRCLL